MLINILLRLAADNSIWIPLWESPLRPPWELSCLMSSLFPWAAYVQWLVNLWLQRDFNLVPLEMPIQDLDLPAELTEVSVATALFSNSSFCQISFPYSLIGVVIENKPLNVLSASLHLRVYFSENLIWVSTCVIHNCITYP